jgi:cytoskeletal protein RodZ
VFTPDGRTNVRRRFIALLAAGLLLVVGFAAAAVASGGSPFGLLKDQSATVADTTTGDALDQTTTDDTTSAESTTDESSEDESAEDEKADEKTTTDATATTSSQKVTICHHTGSKKHPFHSIAVDEHALAAHTGHGDTVGACPAITASTGPAAKHGKPKHSGGKARDDGRSERSEQGQKHGNGQSHRPEKHAGGPSR